MGRIWTLENKYRRWLDVEIAVCEVLAEDGRIPVQDLEEIKKKAGFDVKRIDEIEQTTHHDVIAFLTSVAEHVGPASRFIHQGLTSSDVVDTANALLLTEAADLLLADMDRLLEVLKAKAFEWKDLVMIGRSHGVHAEPTTFGIKFALWHAEMARNRNRLLHARESVRVGKISGAVGTFANIEPDVEERVCGKLGLMHAPVSTQIIQRDRYAEFFAVAAITGCTIEKIAVEIRHLQRTEVREAEEFFREGQKGSSAMPHKRNPIASENLSGLARVLRGNALAAMENVALWHERDISHSSVERVIGPDATIALDFMLNRFTNMIDKLVIYPEKMLYNLNMTHGIIFSQMVLLSLVEKGLTRESAYAIVQNNAMKSWKEGLEFKTLLENDDTVNKYLTGKDLAKIFNLNNFLKNLDFILSVFSRIKNRGLISVV